MSKVVKNLAVLLFLDFIINRSFIFILLTIPYGYIIYSSGFLLITQKTRFLQGSSFNNNIILGVFLVYILPYILHIK